MTAPSPAPLWIFGYGSLIWRPAFAYAERRPAWVHGFDRRFWQGSPDHRGVPGRPGRVVTLLPAPEQARCWGAIYRVAPGHEAQVLATLDHRERGGYERYEVEAIVAADGERVPSVLVYVATPANPHWLGEAALEDIARQVARSVGPSGPNAEYVLRLAESLVEMGARDDHVEALAALVARECQARG
ncbi:gamma-glutamylcyclotransferase [Pseudenhygromyxa sp. WMMC2535]|uniref:gamma-glutamylcyclotransferase n=1 Tax=Pseudenhygromyxa sp. WMMC2535 TaxID=2712867 RepID=UPI0015525B33|nr:gamma-glutamylcyclotransferase [Pseudenhygromyxa sp. WMMC2535]NVB40555.1 gamma-glutamylcyclotransferase [Pseudenhygromyxa sp. WMMC2535]